MYNMCNIDMISSLNHYPSSGCTNCTEYVTHCNSFSMIAWSEDIIEDYEDLVEKLRVKNLLVAMMDRLS